jgi:hypothetical protein
MVNFFYPDFTERSAYGAKRNWATLSFDLGNINHKHCSLDGPSIADLALEKRTPYRTCYQVHSRQANQPGSHSPSAGGEAILARQRHQRVFRGIRLASGADRLSVRFGALDQRDALLHCSALGRQPG